MVLAEDSVRGIARKITEVIRTKFASDCINALNNSDGAKIASTIYFNCIYLVAFNLNET
jgi:hypothetical protein